MGGYRNSQQLPACHVPMQALGRTRKTHFWNTSWFSILNDIEWRKKISRQARAAFLSGRSDANARESTRNENRGNKSRHGEGKRNGLIISEPERRGEDDRLPAWPLGKDLASTKAPAVPSPAPRNFIRQIVYHTTPPPVCTSSDWSGLKMTPAGEVPRNQG